LPSAASETTFGAETIADGQIGLEDEPRPLPRREGLITLIADVGAVTASVGSCSVLPRCGAGLPGRFPSGRHTNFGSACSLREPYHGNPSLNEEVG
jgi:hypothetical protein